MSDVKDSLLDFIQLAIDLGNSVADDIKHEHGEISENTVLLLSQFKSKHDDLADVLELANGIQ